MTESASSGQLSGPNGGDKWADPKATFRLHEGVSNNSRASDQAHLHRLQKAATKPRAGCLPLPSDSPNHHYAIVCLPHPQGTTCMEVLTLKEAATAQLRNAAIACLAASLNACSFLLKELEL